MQLQRDKYRRLSAISNSPRKFYYTGVICIPRCLRSTLMLLCLYATGTGCNRGAKPNLVGSTAPDFTIQDAQRTISLHDLRGKVVVLNFWATWCPPCVAALPEIQKFYGQYHSKGLEIVGVDNDRDAESRVVVVVAAAVRGDKVTVFAVSTDSDEDAEKYQRFLRERNIRLLTVRDGAQKSNALYATFKFPETYIIDDRGIIRRKFIGPVQWTKPEIIAYLTDLQARR